MADSVTTSLTASPVVGEVNHDDESRMLLGFLQYQRDSVLKIVEGLPEDAWRGSTPAVGQAGRASLVAEPFKNVNTGSGEP